MTTTIRRLRGAALLAVAAATAGCAQMGPIGDILTGAGGGMGGQGRTGEIRGEVRQVSSQYQALELRTDDGRTAQIRFDQQTQVEYQQQRYPVTSLEPGDYVGLRVQQAQNGDLYTDYIVVLRNVRGEGNTGTNGTYGGQYGTQTLDGRVGRIDRTNGAFELSSNQGTTVVTLPYNPDRYARDRFASLRQGEYVRVEGRMLSQGRLELVGFR
ncbi:MAG TPA: hypothetical protein VFQ45_11880 [Longimicrobium sp.]|nr:hypothetical protein [Longimicrobium sp.]